MIHNKFRYLMTLVALFAMTAGAWAQTIAMIGTMCPPDEATTVYDGNTWKWVQCKPAITNGYIDVKMVNGALTADGFTPTATQLVNAFKVCDLIIFGEQGKVSTVQLLNASGEIVNELTVNKALDWNNQIKIQPSQGLITGLATGYTIRINLSEYSLPLTPDAMRKIWTLDKMPAGNVELQVEYYPGMLVKPTNLVGGTMEIKGLTDTTLPEGFEKDDAGNIYVKKDTKFTVIATPAEGYHLVGWSDKEGVTDLEREFTMTDDDFILTAQFSDEYTVALNAEGLSDEEAANWKAATGDNDPAAFPLENVKAGTEVKVTYTGTKKVIGVKAEKKAAPKLLNFSPMGQIFYYYEGETWGQAIQNHPENAANGWYIEEFGITVMYKGRALCDNAHKDDITKDTVVNPNGGYLWGPEP